MESGIGPVLFNGTSSFEDVQTRYGCVSTPRSDVDATSDMRQFTCIFVEAVGFKPSTDHLMILTY